MRPRTLLALVLLGLPMWAQAQEVRVCLGDTVDEFNNVVLASDCDYAQISEVMGLMDSGDLSRDTQVRVYHPGTSGPYDPFVVRGDVSIVGVLAGNSGELPPVGGNSSSVEVECEASCTVLLADLAIRVTDSPGLVSVGLVPSVTNLSGIVFETPLVVQNDVAVLMGNAAQVNASQSSLSTLNQRIVVRDDALLIWVDGVMQSTNGRVLRATAGGRVSLQRVDVFAGGSEPSLVVDSGATLEILGTPGFVGQTQILGQTGAGIPRTDSPIAVVDGGTLSVADVTLSGGNSQQPGGLVSVRNNGSLIIRDSRLNEGASPNGGLIHADGAFAVVIRNSELADGSATERGGLVSVNNTADVVLEDVVLTRGNAGVEGGGLYLRNSEGRISGGEISFNGLNGIANGLVGGGVSQLGGEIVFEGGVFVQANEANEGAGLALERGTVVVQGASFLQNEATKGGAIRSFGTTGDNAFVVLQESRVHNNTALDIGGGLYADVYTDLEVRDVAWTRNEAIVSGGAIHVEMPLLSSLEKGFFCGNVSSAGAGIYALGGPGDPSGPPWSHLVFAYNEASAGYGGGLHMNEGAIELNRATFMANRGSAAGAAIYIGGAGELALTDALVVHHADTAAVDGVLGAGPTLSGSTWGNTAGDVGGNLTGTGLLSALTADPLPNLAPGPPLEGLCGQVDWVPDPDTLGDGAAAGTPEEAFYPGFYDRDGDGFSVEDGDCADLDNTINPGATEICGTPGVDEDCDGLVDAEDPSVTGTFEAYPDFDQDGWGDASAGVPVCELTADLVLQGGDCDDGDGDVNPSAFEVCDPIGVDEDCNGLVNLDDPNVTGVYLVYEDADGDEYGVDAVTQLTCAPLDGWSAVGGDCDDLEPLVNPGATEVCDAEDVDEDCDGLVNAADADVQGVFTLYVDDDLDGFGDDSTGAIRECQQVPGFVVVPGDCDDADDTIHPNATDVAWDGVDQDCNGSDTRTWLSSGCSALPAPTHRGGGWLVLGALLAIRRARSRS